MVHIGNAVRITHRTPLQRGGPGALGVAHQAVAHLPGEIQAGEAALQPIHHPQALLIMAETMGAQLVQRPLPCMAKGGMPQIMPQGNGFGQILVQAQRPGNGAGNLIHLQRVGQPGAVMIPSGERNT